MESFPILKLPVELQLMVLNKVECTNDRYKLACALDDHYEVHEYLNYICGAAEGFNTIIAPWLRTNNRLFRTNVYITCHCWQCTYEAKRDYEKMMADEYDYQLNN